MRSIFDAKIGHDGDPVLRRDVLKVQRRTNAYGVSFGKDIYDLRTRGKRLRRRTGHGYFL